MAKFTIVETTESDLIEFSSYLLLTPFIFRGDYSQQ